MAALAGRGHRATVLQATIFDSPAGAKATAAPDGDKPFRFVRRGVNHLVVPTKRGERGFMTADEEERFLTLFRELLRKERPDFVLTWGGYLLDGALRAEARRQDVPVVFVVFNGTYRRADTFAHADLVVTDSAATATLYKERLGLDLRSIGTLIDPAQFKVAARTPRYITFINPLPEKGASVFAALARRARAALPEAEFLVVEARGTWRAAAERLRLDPQDFGNIHVSPMRTDLRAVYANTRVLLVPSLWHDSGPTVIAAALLNGIPVLGSASGGIPEMLAGSGRVFELPPALHASWESAAPDDVVTPWLDALTRLLRDEAFYAEESAKALESAKSHDLDRNVSRFLEAVLASTPARAGAS